MRKYLINLTILSVSVSALVSYEIPQSNLMNCTSKNCFLKFDSKEQAFEVNCDGENNQISYLDLDCLSKMIIKENALEFFMNQKSGYFLLSQNDNGSYRLACHLRIKGGGPISGGIAYAMTKAICYGTAIAAASTAVVATGGVAGAASGAAVAAATSSLGATTGASVVGAAIAGSGLAGEAAVVTADFVSSSASMGGAIAVVESSATTVGAIFTAIPFLP